MKTLKLSKIFDFLFGTGFVFLLCFLWSRFFIHNLTLTICLSIVLTMCLCTFFHLISSKKEKKINFNQKELKNASNLSVFFLLSTEKEILKTNYLYLNKKYSVTIKPHYLVINKNVLFPIYSTSLVTDRDIILAYSKIKNADYKKLIVTCKKYDDSARQIANLIKDKKIILLNEFDAYQNIYKPLCFDIPEIKTESKSKKKLKDFLSFAFCKQRTKGYVVVSIFLLLSSFVLRYNIYYLIFASITTLFALYSHFNRRFNQKQTMQYNLL